jgi:predicted RNA-binding Zn-ribbon protein involved in translation (DUF1610 family)
MGTYTGQAEGQLTDGRPQVVCVWCGSRIRSATKAAKRMCQPCFERMMREHSRAHRQGAVRSYASER